MGRLSQEIESATVPPQAVRLWWLGGAGFAFKTHAGRIVYVDPYLSDAVTRLHGFKRMCLSPIAAEEVKADLVISSHEHTDHLDPDALPVIARNNPQCRFAGSASCMGPYGEFGIEPRRRTVLRPNRSYDLGGVTIHTARADHGDYAPTAVAMLLDFDGVRILYTGDTALRPEWFKPLYALKPEVLIPCINGNFGNMNHVDAARMAAQARPRLVVPCHFWMFPEHGGDPAAFLHACRHFCPRVKVAILSPGEGLTCRARR
ncbi:MAG: MBL fold metallo-hydrolase [Planctomycetes bacterium]|nr:MBL fold metallo-hydrolase [Planctomycetota bacterium]